MRRTLSRAVMLAVPLLLVPATSAWAENDGRGFYGATNDKVVTNAGFIVIGFFALFVLTMTLVQRSLDRRKAARKAARKEALDGIRWRGGW
jgi:hypothetical protein